MDLLSPEAIRKQVLSENIQSPLVLYSGVIAAMGMVYSVLFGGDMMAWGISAVAGSVCLGKLYWGYQYHYHYHAMTVVARYHQVLLAKRQQALVDLKASLEALNQVPALKQVEQLNRKFMAFQDVLDRQLNKEELAYARYLTMAETVFVGALDNLQSVIVSASALSGIDIDHIERQLTPLQLALATASGDQYTLLEQKRTALTQRLAMYQQSQQHIIRVLTENEQAMTELDHVTTQLSQISLQQGMELEEAMEELRRLAQRAQKYSTR